MKCELIYQIFCRINVCSCPSFHWLSLKITSNKCLVPFVTTKFWKRKRRSSNYTIRVLDLILHSNDFSSAKYNLRKIFLGVLFCFFSFSQKQNNIESLMKKQTIFTSQMWGIYYVNITKIFFTSSTVALNYIWVIIDCW